MTHQPYLDWSFSDPTRPDETLTHAERSSCKNIWTDAQNAAGFQRPGAPSRGS